MGEEAGRGAWGSLAVFSTIILLSVFASSNADLNGELTEMPLNIVPLPSGWWIDRDAQTYDLTVQHGTTGSLRLDKPSPTTNNSGRECNAITIVVKPGDRVVFSCWMKTTASSLSDAGPQAGARIGMDFYDSHLISGVAGDGTQIYPNQDAANIAANYVPWNTAAWTQRTVDFTVPATIPSDGTYYPTLEARVPSAIILWMQVWSSTYGNADEGQGWFSDPICYLTPLDESPLFVPTFSVFTLSDSTVTADDPVTVSVTVYGENPAGDPTGTVTFYQSNDGGVVWTQFGNAKTLDASESCTSDVFHPGFEGTYLIMAVYSGDANYTDWSSVESLATVNNPITVDPLVTGVLMTDALARMSQVNVGTYIFEAGIVEPGIDNGNTLMRRNLEKMQ